jgi:hypothetical protein
MKILHSAMTGVADILENVPFKEASVSTYSVTYDKVFVRRIKKVAPPVEDLDAKVEAELVSQMELLAIPIRSNVAPEKALVWSQTPAIKGMTVNRWQHRYLPTARLHLGEGIIRMASNHGGQNSLSEERLDSYFAASLESLWSAYTTEMLRKVRDSQERGLARILGAVLSPSNIREPQSGSIDLDRAYECVMQFMKRHGPTNELATLEQFKERYKLEASLRQVVQDISRIEEDSATAMAPRTRLEEIIRRLFTGHKTISFTDNAIQVESADKSKIGLASLSSGEKHLMRILVEALLIEESTILIDEPELSMHVDWQTELVPTLRVLNPEAQFVLATHSPEVMASVPDDQVFAL